MEFIAELKRRNVVRVGLLYAVGGWLILQVADVLSGLFGLPDWTLRFVSFLLLLGFPLVLVFAWVFEMTPDGLKRERDVIPDDSITRITAKKLNHVIGILLVVTIGLLVADRLLVHNAIDTPQAISSPGAKTTSVADESPTPGTSIAVLPFVNMSPDPDNEYFADGLSEELLNVLAKINGFKVAGRTSSFSFKGQNQDLREIGQKLNVTTVLEGSVRKAGDQVRITAQLINVEDGYHLWSETYDRKLDDIFSIQDDIARQVVDALKKTLLAGQDSMALERPTDNVEAYQWYLRGRHQLAKRTREGMELALEAFREATRLDPGFARAWSGMADALSLLGSYGYAPVAEVSPKAEQAINTALELDPMLDEAYASRGFLLKEQMASEEQVVAAFQRALELNPSNAMAHTWLSSVLFLAGDWEEAGKHIRRAYELDPLSGIVLVNYAWYLFRTGDTAQARRVAIGLQELDTSSSMGPNMLSAFAHAEGDDYGYMHGQLRVLELDPRNLGALMSLTYAFIALGDMDAAEGYLDRARDLPDNSGVIYADAILHKHRGNPEAGLEKTRLWLAGQPEDTERLIVTMFVESVLGQAEDVLGLCRRLWKSDSPPASYDNATSGVLAAYLCARALKVTGYSQQAQQQAEYARTNLDKSTIELPFVKHYRLFELAAALGHRDEALKQLRKAIEMNIPPSQTSGAYLPSWVNRYRDDPDFKPLFAELNRRADELYARLSADGLTSGNRVKL